MNRILQSLAVTCLFILAASLSMQAQEPLLSTAEKKGDEYVSYQNFMKAITEYRAALERKQIEPAEKDRVRIKLADVYYYTRSYLKAESYFEQVAYNLSAFTPSQAAAFLTTLIHNGKYRRATELAEQLCLQEPFASNRLVLNLAEGVKYQANTPDTASVAITKAPFNLPGSTFWCARYEDGIMFIHIDDSAQALLKGAAFYHYDGQRSKRYTKVPQTMQAGPATFSRDGSTMIYTDNRFRDNKMVRSMKGQKFITNSLRIIELQYNPQKQSWEKPKELFKNKKEYSICHPALSDDGQRLYFAADFSDSQGSSDLYMSRKTGKGWGEPVNLGRIVNTGGEELYPNVFGNTLCFTSNGLEGFGGMDIYSVKLNDEGFPVLGTLKHMPYPINTVYNDYAYMQEKEGSGYFSTDRPNNNDLDDIYSWTKRTPPVVATPQREEPKPQKEEPKPAPVQVVEAVKEAEEVRPETIAVAQDLAAGITASDITVYYKFGSSTLSGEALKAIDAFMASLNRQTPRLLVLGYTDVIGVDASNQELSTHRAVAVKEYLVRKGYPRAAIEAVGKGQLPLNESDQIKHTTDLKAKLAPARKAEIKILEKR